MRLTNASGWVARYLVQRRSLAPSPPLAALACRSRAAACRKPRWSSHNAAVLEVILLHLGSVHAQHTLEVCKHCKLHNSDVLRRAQVHPIVVQGYKSAACFATCWLALLVVPLRFTWWGTLGAAIWVRSYLGHCGVQHPCISLWCRGLSSCMPLRTGSPTMSPFEQHRIRGLSFLQLPPKRKFLHQDVEERCACMPCRC